MGYWEIQKGLGLLTVKEKHMQMSNTYFCLNCRLPSPGRWTELGKFQMPSAFSWNSSVYHQAWHQGKDRVTAAPSSLCWHETCAWIFVGRKSKWINSSLPIQVGIKFSPCWGSCLYHKLLDLVVIFVFFCFPVRLWTTRGQGPVCAYSCTSRYLDSALYPVGTYWIVVECLISMADEIL